MNELLTHENERIAAFFKNLDRILGSMAQMADNCRPLLDGERFLSDKELAERLKSAAGLCSNTGTKGVSLTSC